MLEPPIRKILLVEDDEQGVIPAELFFDEDTWEPEGTAPPELLVARTGVEFESLIEEHGDSIEAIVTDIALSDDPTNLGNSTGIDHYARLREKVPHVPCLAITGQAPDSEAIKALKSGVVDYVKKPFSWNQLWAQIEKKVAIVRLDHSTRRFKGAISEIVSALGDLDNLNKPQLSQELLRKIAEVAVLACGAQGGWLFLAGPDQVLKYEIGVGLPPPADSTGPGLYQDVFKTGMEQCFYLTGEEDVSSLAGFEKDKGALLAVPLPGHSGSLGVLEIARPAGSEGFSPNQVSLMNQFAVLAGVTVEAHRRELDASQLLIKTLERALHHQGEIGLAQTLESLELPDSQGSPDESRRLLSALQKIKREAPEHLEFWSATLERFCESL